VRAGNVVLVYSAAHHYSDGYFLFNPLVPRLFYDLPSKLMHPSRVR